MHHGPHATLRRLGWALLAVGSLLAALSWSSPSGAAPANRGTIKIDGSDIASGHDNDPHVACAFSIEWFGYDAGNQSSLVTFDGQPPTGGGSKKASYAL